MTRQRSISEFNPPRSSPRSNLHFTHAQRALSPYASFVPSPTYICSQLPLPAASRRPDTFTTTTSTIPSRQIQPLAPARHHVLTPSIRTPSIAVCTLAPKISRVCTLRQCSLYSPRYSPNNYIVISPTSIPRTTARPFYLGCPGPASCSKTLFSAHLFR